MATTRQTIILYAKEYARTYSKEQIQAARRAVLDAKGRRITSWSDIGISNTSTLEFSNEALLLMLRLAEDIMDGKPIPPIRPSANSIQHYFQG